MRDKEKAAGIPHTYQAQDEAATSKLWEIYVSEAEKYDRALVESWRSDMEGMLIFAGLFSASLTAFLMESYKTLSPDPADTTVLILTQILVQLGPSSNGSVVDVPLASSTFVPPATSLICNAFWFLSLGLSLSCALIATLVEQWAREFLHKANVNSDPVTRARILSYLYYGLKRFNMHAVVEVIPLLLHLSLFFFLSGLVAFLLPINLGMTVVAASPLFFVMGIYVYLTILPVIELDCPYRTPVSGTAWRLLKNIADMRHRVYPGSNTIPSSKSMLAAITFCATEPSLERTERDKRALVWMLSSLKNDYQLEVFLEAIPDVVWSPKGRRRIHDDHIHTVARSTSVQLWTRIRTLLVSSDSGLLSPEAAIRRQITCYKALWTISSLSIPGDVWTPSHEDVTLFARIVDRSVTHYTVSARALAAWRMFCAFQSQFLDALANPAVSWDPESLSLHLKGTEHHPLFAMLPSRLQAKWRLNIQKLTPRNSVAVNSGDSIAAVLPKLSAFRTEIPHVILLDYLHRSTALESSPYQFDHTISTIRLEHAPLSAPTLSHLSTIFSDTVSTHIATMNSTTEVHRIDKILGILISFQRHPAGQMSIPDGMIRYLNHRTSDVAVEHVAWKCGTTSLWTGLTAAIVDELHLAAAPDTRGTPHVQDDILAALWRLCVLPRKAVIDLAVCDAAFTAVGCVGTSSVSQSLLPLVKLKIFDALRFNHHTARIPKSELILQLAHHTLPTESAVDTPPDLDVESSDGTSESDDEALDAQLVIGEILSARITEGRIQLLAQFLEHCASTKLPYDPVKTVSVLGTFAAAAPVHATHQLRVATSLVALLPAARRRAPILKAAANIQAFDVYADSAEAERSRAVVGTLRHRPWLDDPAACKKMKDFFSEYWAGLSGVDTVLSERVKCILDGLTYLHRDDIPEDEQNQSLSTDPVRAADE
ncbi:hypothetical protein DFH06DRAFT_1034014 [Mycena polygramma]|nr:hypothetical protein DFH06DRAFT_1034014 [Mycena polygramma]